MRSSSAMSDRVLFKFTADWALGYDRNQWILLRRRNFRTGRGWKPSCFIATTKTTLLRVLKEMGISTSVLAKSWLAAMPENFSDWISLQTENGIDDE